MPLTTCTDLTILFTIQSKLLHDASPEVLPFQAGTTASRNLNTELSSSGGSTLTGNCWGDQTRGCGVFIQGSNCSISGNDMWNDYQRIRTIGGCKKCGSFHREDGCLVTINYVYQCDNHG